MNIASYNNTMDLKYTSENMPENLKFIPTRFSPSFFCQKIDATTGDIG